MDALHLTLQAAMGWTNSHLHSFAFGEREYTMPYEEGDLDELQMQDERGVETKNLEERRGSDWEQYLRPIMFAMFTINNIVEH